MFAPFQKYRRLIGLLVVVVALLSIIGWTSESREELTFGEEIVLGISRPIQIATSGIGGRIQAAFSFITEINELSEENARLKDELSDYEQLSVEVTELRQENQRLRNLLDFQKREDFDLEPAKVIGRSPDTWNRIIVLNRGKQDGIEVNMPVVNDEGLVGKIVSTANNTSKVLLLTDPDSAVSGLIQDTREMGIVEGQDVSQMKLQMINIPSDADIEANQKIISSGMGSVYPKGLTIGEVESIEEGRSGFTKKATIDPAVSFQRLEEVFIVFTEEDDYIQSPEEISDVEQEDRETNDNESEADPEKRDGMEP